MWVVLRADVSECKMMERGGSVSPRGRSNLKGLWNSNFVSNEYFVRD